MQEIPNEVMLEDVECPNGCNSEDVFVLSGQDMLHGLPGLYSIYRCSQCGLERTTPRPTASTIGYYYPDNYAPYQNSATSFSNKRSRFKRGVISFLGLNSRKLPSIPLGRMLEIGCASGAYMEHARQLGWVVDGVEFSKSAAEVARAKGFNVQNCAVEEMDPPLAPYEIIVAWMVLEHLHRPVEVLQKLRSMIAPSGYLVILVPDMHSLSRKIFKGRSYDNHLPAHLFHFSKKSLVHTLEKAGWSITKIFWQRNANTLLWSFQYWAEDNKNKFLINIAKWMRVSNEAKFLRLALAVTLGFTRQSGRIEVWAQQSINN
ncbi:hypothetical protein CBI30_03900 [Polynucleobacter aenigmaticus]|uniref:Methyltransferase type 12 n=1 Tax=Polynucleobacter aenigmaticus TaxID=1743164 RepID=A0A254Q351_9BURK|nr:class I SAM-dependent methyltransferase [Polynucleobacter aenigmaticus]OWS71986.1 hypothetical protein CBI30_03900 [Polynucleobacter aenigmaticus]